MTQYAKYISETEIEYPQASAFIGIPNWQNHDVVLRRKGFVPLHDIPESQEGYKTVLDKFSLTEQKITRIEPRREDPVTHQPFIEDVMEEDPETHEMKKVGEQQVTREVPVEFDDSFITVLEYHYVELPPPPEPEQPNTTERDNAEKAIVQEIVTAAAHYNAVQELISIEDITIPNLRALANQKGMPDSEFDALITKLTPYKWQLEAVENTTWAECWDGLKSRFPQWIQEILEPVNQ
jgi:hypothetical protein